MRILRNILLMAFPIAIMVSLYGFIINGSSEQFRGLNYLYRHISTFPGLDLTFDTIESIKEYGDSMIDSWHNADWLNVLGSLFTILGYTFLVPITIVISIIQDIWWVLSMLFIA